MTTFLTILVIIVCVLLVLIILIQNPKGGGLAAEFSSSNQFMGVRKTADFLEKATWTLAISLLVLSLLFTATKSRDVQTFTQESEIQEPMESMPQPLQNIPPIQEGIPTPKN